MIRVEKRFFEKQQPRRIGRGRCFWILVELAPVPFWKRRPVEAN